MKTVFMFSGQGAQYAGMGKELYRNYAVAKDIFDRADAVLGYSIKDICFQDEKKLGETEYAQPAILTMSIAAMKVLEEQGVRANMTAGLSLGEYSAYVASGAMDFEEAVALVQKRGRFMTEAVAKAAELAKEKGAKLAVKLKVSGPFHTSLLQPAADKLKPELEKLHISDMKVPVYTNVNAQIVADKDDIIPILTKQICCPVRWADIIRNMNEQGADTFIELGPGKALTGFVKRTLKGVNMIPWRMRRIYVKRKKRNCNRSSEGHWKSHCTGIC